MASKQANRERRLATAHDAYWILSNGQMCCASCGHDDIEVLEIDHISPIKRKSNGLKEMAGDNLRRCVVKEHRAGTNVREICQLLCANCHVKKTRRERVEMVEESYRPEKIRQNELF